MNILKRFLFGTVLLISMIFVVSADGIDLRIKQLNEDLVCRILVRLEALKNVSRGALPNHFLIDGKASGLWFSKVNFCEQAPKILFLINFLLKNKEDEGCKKALDEINEIFYLQCSKIISDTESGKDLTWTLFMMYHLDSLENDEFTYSYSYVPLALLMTNVIINFFGTKTNGTLNSKDQLIELTKQLALAKSKLLNNVETKRSDFGDGRSLAQDELGNFVDRFYQEMVIKNAEPTKKGYVEIASVLKIAATLGTVCFAAYMIKSGLENCGGRTVEKVKNIPNEMTNSALKTTGSILSTIGNGCLNFGKQLFTGVNPNVNQGQNGMPGQGFLQQEFPN
jgi:hypothetical protein